ncbi:MAG: hypothetical protein JXR51_16550 [Bacteroidales bacterium]|nr:hypothetical protein [Bacteroidales bacterium]MBN2758778.1 hypothetical protein [Bacteroidales bacterium]
MKKILVLIILTFVNINLFSQSMSPSDYDSFRYNKTNIFYDDFSSNENSWFTGSTDNKFASIREGKYFVQTLNDESSQTVNMQIDFDNSKDFEIEASIRFVSGTETSGQAFLWGITNDPYEDYGYLFSQTAKFEITNYKDRTYNKFIDWTELDNYKSKQFNLLTIRKYHNVYYFFFNEKMVYSMSFVNFYGKKIGFEIGKSSSIEIDFLKVSYLSSNSVPEAVNMNKNYDNYTAIINSDKTFILKEDFNSNSNEWALSNNENVSLLIKDGCYYFESKGEFYHSLIPFYINQQDNFEIEARYKVVDSEKEFENCIMWGVSEDKKNSYRFGITKSGFYTIYKMAPGVIDYVDYTQLSNFNKLNYNKLTIRKINNKLYFFINEELVHSMNFEAFFGDWIGLLAGKKCSIVIDYFYVSKIK